MDYSNLKLPKPNFTSIFWAIALGVFVAVLVYQAQVRGWVPFVNLSLPKGSTIETKTLISEENAVIKSVDSASPSVVAIGINRKVINPFDPLAIPKKMDTTIGTGFVAENDGIIVTNKHVVSESGTYTVVTKDGQKYEAKKIYKDPNLDLAIVKIDATGLTPLDLADSSKLKVGQTVIAIGNALGKFTNTVTTGVISGLGRKVIAGDPFSDSVESLDNLIQTDAAINLGNSGGPLLNSSGQVIGVSVATTEGAQNIAFGIPINSVKQIVLQFVKNGTIFHPYLGIQYKFISKDLAALNEVPQGIFIQSITAGGPADKSGVKEGDIITKINGHTIDAEEKITGIISASHIGQELELTIWRDGKESKVTVIITDSPS